MEELIFALCQSLKSKTSSQTGSGPVVQAATLEEVQPTLLQAFLIKQSNRTVWLHIVYFIEAEFWMCTFQIVNSNTVRVNMDVIMVWYNQ